MIKDCRRGTIKRLFEEQTYFYKMTAPFFSSFPFYYHSLGKDGNIPGKMEMGMDFILKFSFSIHPDQTPQDQFDRLIEGHNHFNQIDIDGFINGAMTFQSWKASIIAITTSFT